MKKMFSALLALAMMVSLVSCGNQTNTPSDASKSSGSSQSSSASQSGGSASSSGQGQWDLTNVEAATLKLAHIYAPEHPFTIGLDKFSEQVYELSEGKLEIAHYPAAQLGDEPSLHEGLKNGSIDMVVMGISEAGKDYEPVLVMDAPFIFSDAKQMLAANDSELGQKLWADFADASDITMLSPIYYGARQLTTNKSVSSVADLAGLKIRVPSQENSVAVWNTLGATATPMNLSEVYLSLQTGVVDGQENPIATIISSGFDEVCGYMNMTSHSVQNCPLFIASSVYEKLDPTLKEILDYCVDTYVSAISQDVIDYENGMIDEIRADGKMEVNENVDVAGFREKLADYIQAGAATWGEGVYDTLAATPVN